MRRAAFVIGAVAVLLAVVPASPVAAADVSPMLVQINDQLALDGASVRVEMAEWITSTDGPEFGRTVYASNRGNKQLSSHFVPGDDRRFGTTEILWINDELDGATASGLTADDTRTAIERAMDTWQQQTCSTIPLLYLGSYDFDFGYVQYLLGFGGVPGWAADITHAGWLPGAFFDAVAPGGSEFILGVTFTFIWIDDETGEPTDINNDGKADTAFREIYYNDVFSWAIDGTYDVETVALHETGHGLSQGHFGDIFRTKNGKLHFAPLAVMNAAYSRVQHELRGSDNGGHCSIWGSWPNK